MSRPESHTVQYFPFIVKNGKTLFLLESKYGCKGTGFFTNVLRILSNTPDHHICLQDEVSRRLFYAEVKCDEESALDMINMMVLTGKIDRLLWEEKQVIFSEDFRQSITDAYNRRSNKIIEKDDIYSLYGLSQKLLLKNTDNNPVNDDINPINSCNNPQSKVKESKLEESKKEKPENEDNNPPLENKKTQAEIMTDQFYIHFSRLSRSTITKKTGDAELAQSLLERGIPLSDILLMIPKYFTCKAWFNFDRSDTKRERPMFSFKNFVQHYDEIMPISTLAPMPKICPVPNCGSQLVNGDCLKCGYRKGDNLNSQENMAFWKYNLEKRRQSGNSS